MVIVWIIIAGLVQASVACNIDLLLFFTAFLGFKYGRNLGLIIGLGIGIYAGILSPSPFVGVVILHSLVGFTTGFLRSSVYYSVK